MPPFSAECFGAENVGSLYGLMLTAVDTPPAKGSG